MIAILVYLYSSLYTFAFAFGASLVMCFACLIVNVFFVFDFWEREFFSLFEVPELW